MQFKSLIAATAFVATAFGAIDWTSDATLACAKQNWAAIKAKADPLLPSAPVILTPAQAAALSSLLSGKSTMPADPSDAFLRALPTAIPTAILDQISGDLINACLATYHPPAASTTAPASTVPASTGAPASTAPASTGAPASTAPASTDAPATTQPPKCKPRH
ncbi:hypothetical protein FBU59_001947 [Linderina macrospora]|uniref:Uncharacterized protein n=1 Tax=Linderina macrospora TaxID=4868 RepID=A0ACC1JCL6_9FUNG|nr:hypothetical protein FBU59_001947 [Linderina macrospora]